MEIYNNIKLLRKELNLSQTEFAEKLGMTLRGIQNWEASKGDIKSAKISLINSIFNVNINWLLTGNGEMFNNEENKSNSNLTSAQMLAINAIKNLADDGEVKDIVKYIEERQIIKEAKAKKHKNVG